MLWAFQPHFEYYILILNYYPPLTYSVVLSVEHRSACTRDWYVLYLLVEHSKPFDSLMELYSGYALFMLGSNRILILQRHRNRKVKHDFQVTTCFALQNGKLQLRALSAIQVLEWYLLIKVEMDIIQRSLKTWKNLKFSLDKFILRWQRRWREQEWLFPGTNYLHIRLNDGHKMEYVWWLIVIPPTG